MPITHTRRRLLETLLLAGAAGLLRPPAVLAAEGPLETTSIRLTKVTDMCMAPQFVMEDLLRAEGFTDIQYVEIPIPQISATIASGKADLGLSYIHGLLLNIDRGQPITMVAGVMVGCVEVFAQEAIRSVGDLKGKKLGVAAAGSGPHGLLAAMLAHVGLDPAKDVELVADPKYIQLFIDGKVDAIELVPPASQELRARKIGHVIINNAVDRPWSDYFCCMLAGYRDFVRNNPVATKRVMRAMLKASDLCAREPERMAHKLVDGGFTPRYDLALEAIKENVFNKWRDYDAEDTVRFYTLRLHDVGFIKSNPQKLIAESTDWRFFDELKRELKA
jgi:NitT/TauT family transport system substrate-binding protein